MTEMKCIGNCGRTLALNDFQRQAVLAGVFRSWKCADCVMRDRKIDEAVRRMGEAS